MLGIAHREGLIMKIKTISEINNSLLRRVLTITILIAACLFLFFYCVCASVFPAFREFYISMLENIKFFTKPIKNSAKIGWNGAEK